MIGGLSMMVLALVATGLGLRPLGVAMFVLGLILLLGATL